LKSCKLLIIDYNMDSIKEHKTKIIVAGVSVVALTGKNSLPFI